MDELANENRAGPKHVGGNAAAARPDHASLKLRALLASLNAMRANAETYGLV